MLVTLKELWTDLREDYGFLIGGGIFLVCTAVLVFALAFFAGVYYSLCIVDWLKAINKKENQL